MHDIKVPVLFSTAENDTTVSNKWIEKYYNEMKDANHDARFVFLPEVCHTIPIFEDNARKLFLDQCLLMFDQAI